ncbi:hypothetical protein Acsp06_43500 [Actinomycetospora sp. NBRC 106375]|uniref:hypothetical protein n=1 Tax=Actinomycetospora sp. NBRC 106375 TaxID=3032207 RepID=UPI0024A4D9FE|nr:hypothetical protein [Actinomycetospora sp. NBRC 106375]GLZ48165.1 hypothetical protein Acsp06_43500 [Actinomycetospora sp. NBRC 106375]
MTAFGGIFRSPKLEGVEESDDNGERARFVGLDLESGVVRVRAARSEEPDRAERGDTPTE